MYRSVRFMPPQMYSRMTLFLNTELIVRNDMSAAASLSDRVHLEWRLITACCPVTHHLFGREARMT